MSSGGPRKYRRENKVSEEACVFFRFFLRILPLANSLLDLTKNWGDMFLNIFSNHPLS